MKNHPSLPRVSVIILNYNAREFLENCLESVFDSVYPNLEVILVDNNSHDRSIESVLPRFGSRMTIVKLKENFGFSAGNNIGVSHSSGDYLVFLNPDTVVDRDWLGYLVNTLELDSSVGIVQPKLLQMDGRHLDSAGGYLNRLGLAWSKGAGEEDKGQYNRSSRIFYAKGAALAIKREIWDKLGGFDSLFFLYYEETDLCWRAWNIGYDVMFEPRAVVYHFGGGVLRRLPFHLKFHEARGRLALLMKNYPIYDVMVFVPLTVFLHFVNTVHFLVSGDVLAAIAVVKGTFSTIAGFKAIWSSRKDAERANIRLNRQRGVRALSRNTLHYFV